MQAGEIWGFVGCKKKTAEKLGYGEESGDAFSKEWENHEATLALFFAYYNFCRVHSTIKKTPAIEAKLTDHAWSVEELLMAAATHCQGTTQFYTAQPFPSSTQPKEGWVPHL